MHIMVFFTFDVSLKEWDKTGLLARELLIYKRLIKMGYKISLLTYGDERDLKYKIAQQQMNIIPVYKKIVRPSNIFFRLLQSLLIPIYFRSFLAKADIYKTNQMYGAWIPLIAKILFKKKLIIRCGYEYLRNALRDSQNLFKKIVAFIPRFILEFLSYNCADRIIISNRSDAFFVRKMFRIKQQKIYIVKNYIDTDLFKPIKRGPLKVMKKNHLLYIGRLNRRKNLLSLLDAIKSTGIHLDIIGQGEQRQVLLEYASNNNIHINFLGLFRNNELPELINQYSIVVLPSLYENNPKVLLEAMACGVAVVGTNVDGIREIIKNGYDGLLCSTDYLSIRNSIYRLIHDTQLRRKLGINARKRILSEFRLERIVFLERLIYENI